MYFCTHRSRLYGAAALIALDRPDVAHKLAEEAITGKSQPHDRRFYDQRMVSRSQKSENELQERLEAAGAAKIADIRFADSCGYMPETLWERRRALIQQKALTQPFAVPSPTNDCN